MWKKITVFAGVAAGVATTSAAVLALALDDRAAAVPGAVVSGPPPEELAREYPQAFDMHKAYQEFRAGPAWHGAFAVGKGGAFGALSGYADPRVGRLDALAHCSAWGEDCRIVAEIRPARALPDDAAQLSGPQAEALHGVQRGRGGRAFAADARGYWGSAFGFASRPEAQATALGNCRKAQVEGQEPGRPELPCRMVWVSR